MSELAWFRRAGDVLVPLPPSRSSWGAQQMHGVAVSGLLARALESALAEVGRTEMVPARYNVDLFRPALMTETSATATVTRQGNRLALLDAVIEQDGVAVARASATFLRPSAPSAGEVWSAGDRPVPPDLAATRDDALGLMLASDKPWSSNMPDHANSGRHQLWYSPIPIVAGEEITPFQAFASAADNASMVANWGSNGVQYINADISLALSRRPTSTAVGMRSLDHIAADGLVVGAAEVFDRLGVLGIATVTGIANKHRAGG
jgi:Thioesterase-like superfamily